MKIGGRLLVFVGLAALIIGFWYGIIKGASFVVRTVWAAPTMSCEKLAAGVEEDRIRVTRGTMSLETSYVGGQRTFERLVDIGSGCIRETRLLVGGVVLDYGCRLKDAKPPTPTVSNQGIEALLTVQQQDLAQLRKDTESCYASQP